MRCKYIRMRKGITVHAHLKWKAYQPKKTKIGLSIAGSFWRKKRHQANLCYIIYMHCISSSIIILITVREIQEHGLIRYIPRPDGGHFDYFNCLPQPHWSLFARLELHEGINSNKTSKQQQKHSTHFKTKLKYISFKVLILHGAFLEL